MKRQCTDNRGYTLIELISAIAILSIVGISCFTLLMFSIRTNNTILLGTNACRDAEFLNDRLERLFENATLKVDFDNKSISIPNEPETMIVLQWDDAILKQDSSVLQEDIEISEVAILMDGTLVRITYTIDQTYKCSKIFSCKNAFLATEDEQPTNP